MAVIFNTDNSLWVLVHSNKLKFIFTEAPQKKFTKYAVNKYFETYLMAMDFACISY